MTPQSDVALAPFSTMAVGGPARWFVAARSDSEVIDALMWAHTRNVNVQVLGGGSNVVIADDGFDGLVIHVDIAGVDASTVNGARTYCVGAGEPWDPFVKTTVGAHAAGIECLSGIPGLVGATPIQNVGAYGQDVSETITRVHVVDRQTQSARSLTNAECGFGYRTSRFKREDVNRFIVTAVEFSLSPGAKPTLQYADVVEHFTAAGNSNPTLAQVREAILAIRRRKGMVIEEGNAANHSCGSFFVNPIVAHADLTRVQELAATAAVPHYVVGVSTVKIPAAWLIERAGFAKGLTRGHVGISPFQAQAIINLGGACAAEVLALAHDVKRAVWETFGVALVPEPVFVGFAPSSELRFLLTDPRSH